MEYIKNVFKRPLVRIIAIAVVFIIIGAAGGGIYSTQQVPDQPIDFPHSTHVGLGLQCLYCHPAATWGPTAGIPSPQKCWGCHQQIEKESTELTKLASFVNEGKSIPWVPVFIQPDFVHFDHRPHVAKGISCESCHGEISQMRTAQPRAGQNMGWCLDCHKKMMPEDFTRLSDCSTCHY